MSDAHDPGRRILLSALAGLTLVSALPIAAAPSSGNSHILVVYFSRSGNTHVIAGVIHRSLNTDLFEIEPAAPYPEDYFQTVAQASAEREGDIKPALKRSLADIAPYQTIFLGFPIWGTTVPSVVRTFLGQHDFTGKTLIPFITHGGYGAGDSEAVLAWLAPGAKREKPLIMECDQERRTTETVARWLEAVRS